MVIVDIALAIICFTTPASGVEECHNVLVGPATKPGEYTLQQRLIKDPLYGGDVLQFDENETEVYAIHRVWLGRPHERRERRLKSNRVRDRHITMGCINVDPVIYDRLVDCCSNSPLVIK